MKNKNKTMDILSKIESLTTTADNMELAMDLLACKLTNFSELSELVEDVDEIKELEKEVYSNCHFTRLIL